MNLDIRIDKSTCFYYWVQAISGWDVYSGEQVAYDHYATVTEVMSLSQKNALSEVGSILKNSSDPRRILADLYTGRHERQESDTIAALANQLLDIFSVSVWNGNLQWLKKWQRELNESNLSALDNPLQKVANFLSSGLSIDRLTPVYLLPNPDFGYAIGHAIRNTEFILLHPAGNNRPHSRESTLNTLVHEYVHLLEFHSHVTDSIFKRSYEIHIKPRDLNPPEGYTWKLIYSEIIAYCFANNITGGLFNPEIYNRPRPVADEMREGFERLIRNGECTTQQIIAWVAVQLLPLVDEYLQKNKLIDERFADKMGKLLLEFYLTKDKQ